MNKSVPTLLGILIILVVVVLVVLIYNIKMLHEIGVGGTVTGTVGGEALTGVEAPKTINVPGGTQAVPPTSTMPPREGRRAGSTKPAGPYLAGKPVPGPVEKKTGK